MNWLSAAEVAATPDPEILIPDFMNRYERFILAGQEKLGKSFVVLQAAFELAHGLPLFGCLPAVRPMRVMLLQMEISPSEFKSRYGNYVELMGTTDNLWVCSNRDFRVDNDAMVADLLRDVEGFQPDLIMFDPLYYMHDSAENTDAIKTIFRTIDLVTTTCAVWVVHHMSKAILDNTGRVVSRGRNDIRGSSVILGWPDGIVEIRTSPIADGALTLRSTLRNHPPMEQVELVRNGNLFVPAPMLTYLGVLHRLRAAGGSLPVTRLIGSRVAVDRILSQLAHDGAIRDGRDDGDNRARIITLTAAGLALASASPATPSRGRRGDTAALDNP